MSKSVSKSRKIVNAEADSAVELSELQKGMRDRARQESKRFQDATDSEYWFCVCFLTRADKEAFLKALSLDDIGDKYLNGHEVAKRLSIQLSEGE